MLHNSVLSVQLEKCKKKNKKKKNRGVLPSAKSQAVSQIAQTAPNHATHHIFIYIETLFFWINILKLSHII